MTQEDKELLLIDLCARLPYEVLCEDMEGKTRPLFGITPTQHFIVTLDNATDGTNGLKFCTIDFIKPYLRPMSSMTEEEKTEYRNIAPGIEWNYGIQFPTTNKMDWLNKHYLDYRGLIEKGLALEALEGMYNIKEK